MYSLLKIIWFFIPFSIAIWFIINYYREKAKEKVECQEAGYHRIIGKQHTYIAKEFMEREYNSLFSNPKIVGRIGLLGGLIGPAQRYLVIEGIYKDRKIKYQFLVNPSITDADGKSVNYGYIAHVFFIKHKYVKFSITPSEKLLCKDIVKLPNGMARFYLMAHLGAKMEFKEPFLNTILKKDEFKIILDSIIDILEKDTEGIQVSEESVSKLLPERFKITEIKDDFLTKMAGKNRRIVESEIQ